MRWQIEAELVSGKGQFVCGEKHCTETEALRTWEVNFGYIEGGEKKNSLVKLSKRSFFISITSNLRSHTLFVVEVMCTVIQ